MKQTQYVEDPQLAEDERRMLLRMVSMEQERKPRERVPLNGSTIIGTYGTYSAENANQAAQTAWRLAEHGYLEIDQAHPQFPAFRVQLTDKGRKLATVNKAAEPRDVVKVIPLEEPQLSTCAPEFQKELQRLARSFNRSVDYLWKRWRNYEKVSDGLGQSALLSEFEKSLEQECNTY